jgi:hypothetical protein
MIKFKARKAYEPTTVTTPNPTDPIILFGSFTTLGQIYKACVSLYRFAKACEPIQPNLDAVSKTT